MAALTQDRDTPKTYGERFVQVPAAAAAKAFEGGMLASDAAGNGVPASNTAGLTVIGRCSVGGDNTAGAAGAMKFIAEKGVFGFVGSAALIAAGQAMVGKTVYVVDDQTVGLAADASKLVIAGCLEEIRGTDFHVSVGLANVAGSDMVAGTEIATVANSNAVGGVAVEHVYNVADAVGADYDIVVAEKFEVTEVTVQKRGGANVAGTVTIKKGAAAITNAIAADTDTAITRAGTIDDANSTLNAGDTLRATVTRPGVNGAVLITVRGIKRV